MYQIEQLLPGPCTVTAEKLGFQTVIAGPIVLEVNQRARLDPILPGLVNEGRVMAAETPAEGILSFARERGSDLIVLSAVGVSAVRAILLGSNTRKVVRASACPVLVIPASL